MRKGQNRGTGGKPPFTITRRGGIELRVGIREGGVPTQAIRRVAESRDIDRITLHHQFTKIFSIMSSSTTTIAQRADSLLAPLARAVVHLAARDSSCEEGDTSSRCEKPFASSSIIGITIGVTVYVSPKPLSPKRKLPTSLFPA